MAAQPSLKFSVLAVTGAEAAALLGISRAHFYKLRAADKLPPPVRIGGSVRWLRADLTAWLEMGCPSREQFEQRREARHGR